MKTQFNFSPTPESIKYNNVPGVNEQETGIHPSLLDYGHPSPTTPSRPFGLLTDTAAEAIIQGRIPNLSLLLADLYQAILLGGDSPSAIQFVPVLKKLENLDKAEVRRFLKNPQSRHVLVQNELIKVVLLRWKPGEYTGIHGHPKGGCVFKVLRGSLEEKRYEPGTTGRPLAVSTFRKGSMAYIDDAMAYHAVGNPFNTTAISLHAYTPGIR